MAQLFYPLKLQILLQTELHVTAYICQGDFRRGMPLL